MKSFYNQLVEANVPFHELQIGGLFSKLEVFKAKILWGTLSDAEIMEALYLCYQIRVQMEMDVLGIDRNVYVQSINFVDSTLREFEQVILNGRDTHGYFESKVPLQQYIYLLVGKCIVKHYGFDPTLKHDLVSKEVFELLTEGGLLNGKLIQPILASDVKLNIINRLQHDSLLPVVTVY